MGSTKWRWLKTKVHISTSSSALTDTIHPTHIPFKWLQFLKSMLWLHKIQIFLVAKFKVVTLQMSCANNEKNSKFYSVQTQLTFRKFHCVCKAVTFLSLCYNQKEACNWAQSLISTIKTMTIFSQQCIWSPHMRQQLIKISIKLSIKGIHVCEDAAGSFLKFLWKAFMCVERLLAVLNTLPQSWQGACWLG
jgi:hypothetical protein